MPEGLAIGAGIAQGLDNAIKNFVGIQQAKHKQKQEDEIFKLQKKKTDLELKELEILHGPEMIEGLRKHKQAEYKAQEAANNLKYITISRVEQEMKKKIESGMSNLNALQQAAQEMGLDINEMMGFKSVDQKEVLENKILQGTATPDEVKRYETFKRTTPFTSSSVPEGFEIVGYDQKGQPMVRKIQPTALEKEEAKTQAKIEQSKITSQYNLNLTAEAARDLSDWLVKGYKEGGAGTKYGAMATRVAAEGWLPQDIASKFASSGAIVGKRNEMLMKMFPMLTQQLGKEGSVRLIESVIQRIGQTLPDTHTPPALAKEQLTATLQSMYRISRALENIDLNRINDKNADSFIDAIAVETMNIPINENEQKTLDNFINTSVQPLDEYLGKESSNTYFPSDIKTTSQAVDYLMKQGMTKDQAIQWIRSQ